MKDKYSDGQYQDAVRQFVGREVIYCVSSLIYELGQRGELVNHDFMGLTVWGRQCTGQSICLDRVICDIYDELKKAR